MDKKNIHNDYIKAHKKKKSETQLISLDLDSIKEFSKINNNINNNEVKDTNQSILKLNDLLDDRKEHKKAKISDDFHNDFLKINEESIHEEAVLNENNENIVTIENDIENKNFLPSIQNISAISHNDQSRLNKKQNKENKIFEINRKENIIQNELKLINREKKDYIKQIEKKNHIKMVMVRSKDLLKRN